MPGNVGVNRFYQLDEQPAPAPQAWIRSFTNQQRLHDTCIRHLHTSLVYITCIRHLHMFSRTFSAQV